MIKGNAARMNYHPRLACNPGRGIAMADNLGWKDEYSVGNELIDQQHRKLLSICREVMALSDDGSRDYLEDYHQVLDEMTSYARLHFKDEEALLEKAGYPRMDEHQAQHDSFFSLLSDLIFRSMSHDTDLAELKRFVESWWLGHILNSDLQCRAWLERMPAEDGHRMLAAREPEQAPQSGKGAPS